MELPDEIIYFVKKHHIAVLSTLDDKGRIHCSVKGIVGIEKEGRIYAIDVYKQKTYKNLIKRPTVSITLVDERNFIGYTFQGKGKIVPHSKIEGHIIEEWEKRIIKRITQRVIDSVRSEKGSKAHYEAELPKKPQYLIEVDIDNIIDLSPPHMRKK